MSSNDLDLLTPGSVWLRKSSKQQGKRAKFLFLTNQNLPAKVQVKHPPQVIYADDDGAVYNRDIDAFFELYQFNIVDPSLETKLEALFTFQEAEYDGDEEEQTDDERGDEAGLPQVELGLTVGDEEQGIPVTARKRTFADSVLEELNGEPTEHALDGMQVGFALSSNEDLAVPPLSAQELSAALVIYGQDPILSHNMIQHRLVFKLSERITLDSLFDCFAPKNRLSLEEDTRFNTVDAFEIVTGNSHDRVIWDTWVGVYPEYSKADRYATVLLGEADGLGLPTQEQFEDQQDEEADDGESTDEAYDEQAEVEAQTEEATPVTPVVADEPAAGKPEQPVVTEQPKVEPQPKAGEEPKKVDQTPDQAPAAQPQPAPAKSPTPNPAPTVTVAPKPQPQQQHPQVQQVKPVVQSQPQGQTNKLAPTSTPAPAQAPEVQGQPKQ